MGDIHDKARSGRPRKTTVREECLLLQQSRASPFFNCSRATWELVTRNPCIYENSLSHSLVQWSPWANHCSQTSIKQKTTKELCCICQDPQHRRLIFLMNHPLNCIPIAAYTAENLLEPAWTQASPRKQSSLVEEKSWFEDTSSMGVCERSAELLATSTSFSTKKFLLPITFQTTGEGKFFSWMVRHTSASNQCSWKQRSSRCSRTGKPSHQTWTLLSMSGVRWRRRLGRWNQRILMDSGSPARLVSLPFQITSSISYLSHCQDVWIQSFKLLGVIHNMNYFSQGTMTLCSDVIVACLCIQN